MIGQTVEAEGGEMNESGFLQRFAGKGMIDTPRLVGLTRSFKGIGLSPAWCLIPEVAPSMLKPSRELRPPLRILRGVGVEVSDHEGAFACMLTRPRLKLREWLTFHALCWHVDGRDGHAAYPAPNPVVLELIALSAEARVGL